jgi:hypothetical protein
VALSRQTLSPRRTQYRVQMSRSTAKALLVLAGCMVATSVGAAAPPPHVVAVVPSAVGPRLEPFDARTLAPVRGGWALAVGASAPAAALSPSGSRIAVGAGGDTVLVLDTASGRRLARYDNLDTSMGIYWLGGERLGASGDALLFAVGFECLSSGCGYEPTRIGTDQIIGTTVPNEPVALLREGLVFADNPSVVDVYRGGDAADIIVNVPRMQSTAPFRVVADALRDRLFVIAAAGLVAEIDHVARRPHITYHMVALNGRPFEAAWAGVGRIALWGQNGLGTIDTRTWTTQPVAAGVTGAVATPFGLAAWTDNPLGGLTVYRPDGSSRLHVLAGKAVRAARAVGGYLYVDADARYSINLRTGKVTGPLPSDATIITPTLVSIP